MKKNGFTLVELICVIVLLSIIITTSVVLITNGIEENRKTQNESTMNLIYSATKEYMKKYQDNYDSYKNASYCIKIKELIDDGILIDSLKYNSENYDTEKYIHAYYDINKFKYEVKTKNECESLQTKKYIITNLIKNGSFEKGMNNWLVTSSATDAIVETNITHTGTQSLKIDNKSNNTNNIGIYTKNNYEVEFNHKYYIRGYFYNEFNTFKPCIRLGHLNNPTNIEYNYGTYIIHGVNTLAEINNWEMVSYINNYALSNIYNSLAIWSTDPYPSNTQYYYVDDILVVDLTKSFGVGNEPDKAWCDENITYFDDSTAIFK